MTLPSLTKACPFPSVQLGMVLKGSQIAKTCWDPFVGREIGRGTP